MQTLLELIKYTKEKKKYQLSKLEESFYLDPQIEYKEFLDGTLKSKSAIAIDIEYESSWYLWNYIRDYLEVNKINLDFIANSTKKACLSNFLNYVIGLKATAYDSAILLRNATMNLGQMLFLGWDEKCIKYGKLLLFMLPNKYYDGGTINPLYSWFILNIFCKWQNIELKKEGLNMPENLGIYQEALDNLYSTDRDLIDQIIADLTAYHIQNSDEDVITDEYGNEESAEFCSSDYFIFPVEILMFLCIRKHLGLPDYDISKNEMLSLPINQIPNQPIAYPQGDIVDKIFDKLYKENPDYPRF